MAVEAHAAASEVDHPDVDRDRNESDELELLQGSANLGSSVAGSTAAVIEEVVFFYLQLQQVRDKRTQRRQGERLCKHSDIAKLDVLLEVVPDLGVVNVTLCKLHLNVSLELRFLPFCIGLVFGGKFFVELLGLLDHIAFGQYSVPHVFKDVD